MKEKIYKFVELTKTTEKGSFFNLLSKSILKQSCPAVFCHIYFDCCLVHAPVCLVQVSRLFICWWQRVGIVQLENKIIRSMRREVITARGQSYVWRLPKYWPPTPLSARRVCPGRRGRWGVNILEDERHRIASYSYNLSTGQCIE